MTKQNKSEQFPRFEWSPRVIDPELTELLVALGLPNTLVDPEELDPSLFLSREDEVAINELSKRWQESRERTTLPKFTLPKNLK